VASGWSDVAELGVTTLDLVRKRFSVLSSRQREVSLLLADGLTNVQIAERLDVTVHTVKAHRAEVMRRMEADSFADLMRQLDRLRSAAALPLTDRPAQLHVIVVEDDTWYRNYLTENLAERDFVVVGVADGAGFKAAWADHPADIVILDIELGTDMEDGLAIASRLLASSACGVVMVTARGEVDDRIKGRSIGADAYFSKPVSIDELAVCLRNLGRRLRQG
jgi:DNA-binding NarL/FixJ family response regulator